MWVQHNINAETEYHEIVIMNTECNYINKTTDSNEKAHVGLVQQDNVWCTCALIRGSGLCNTLAMFMIKVMAVALLDAWYHQ